MGEQVSTEDKPSEAPEDTGEASEAPLAPEPEQVMQEAIAADPKLAEGTPAPEGTPDEDATVAPGADDTSMAPVSDPVIEALKADPRFSGASFETAKDLFDSVDNLRTKMSQRDEDAVLGREARGSWDEFKQFEKSKQEEEQGRLAWSPPPMPVGMHSELQKEANDRDPTKVEAYNNRLRYINDRQTAWAEDPDLQLREHTLPAVERLVGEMISQMQHRTKLETALKPHEAYIDKHGAELLEMTKTGMQVEDAIELHQLRRGKKPEAAAKARKADVATMASGKSRARASVPPRAPEDKVDINDPHAILLDEMAKGVVDPDPMALD